MKEIILKKIELTNFKGQAHRVEKFTEGENFITGANGSGKTSVFDAFTWLLFGKDSKGQSEEKAKIKMLDSKGNPIWNTDNSVEATFLVDGKELTLKRTYKEKWRKPQGQAEKVYDGQTTSFSWNGNEKISATEYKKRVSELIDEELFKLITDPMYFANLDVKKRREIVLSMAGEISNEEIKANCKELANFEPTGNVEETRNVAMSARLRTIKERDNYPARIDEQMQLITNKQQQINELKLVPMEEIEAKEKLVETEMKKVEDQLNQVEKSIDTVMKANIKRIEALNEAENYKYRKSHEIIDAANEFNENISKSIKEAQNLQASIKNYDRKINIENENIDKYRNELNSVQNKIYELMNVKEPEADEAVCPMCHRPLDQDGQEAHKQELHENWIANIKLQREQLERKGDTIYAEAVQCKAKLKDLEEQKVKEEQLLIEAQKVAQLERKEAILPNFEEDKEYQRLLKNVPAEISVEDAIYKTRQAAQDRHSMLFQMQLDNSQLKDQHKLKEIAEKDIKYSQERIEKLKQEQMEINQRVAEQEKIIYLCDLWAKTRTELLNERVSNKFNLVKFKMFNYTQEGNPVPVCEITVNGVDYTALNTAATINAGLDIINALINHYQVKAPIFIDNRESVTDIDAPNTQIINLSVTNK